MITVVALITGPYTALAVNKTPAMPKPEFVKALTQLMIESPHSINQLSILFETVGASSDSIKLIRNDLVGKMGASPWPKIKMKGDEIWIDEHPTDIHITSYWPMNISKQGRTWVYERNKTTDQNYFTLVKFLTPPKGSALWKVLVQSALADDGKSDSGKGSAAFGTVMGSLYGAVSGLIILVGTVIVGTTTWPVWSVLIALTAVGAAVGGVLGWVDGAKSDREQRALVDSLLNSNPEWSCSPKFVNITMKSNTNISSIRVDRSDFDNPVKIFDKTGAQVSNKKMSREQKDRIATVLSDCRSPEDAAAFSEKWGKAVASVKGAGSATAAAAGQDSKGLIK
jgi:hypothetical protein